MQVFFNRDKAAGNKYIRKEHLYSIRHMKVKAIITIALIISAALMAAKVSPGVNMEQFREGKYIHIDSMVIEFNQTDADVQIKLPPQPLCPGLHIPFREQAS